MAKVAVTGAGGYIAGHLVASLLESGHHVVGTVRSAAVAAYLWDLPHAKERLELVEADILKESDFATCFQGCEGVYHTASPFFLAKCDPAELMVPAVEGTLNVLRACAKAPSVRRVVVTSSFATIVLGQDHTKQLTPYTEQHWNRTSSATSSIPSEVYRASKVAAEQAGLDFVEREKPHFDLVTIHPPLVLGPWLPGYNRSNESSMRIKEMLTSTAAPGPGGMGVADVRDVVRAHVLAMTTPAARGRYLIATGSFYWTELDAFIAPLRGASLEALEAAASQPFVEQEHVVPYKPLFDCSKALAELAWAPSFTIAQTVAAQCVSLKKAGQV
eukprot:m.232218 g.232218  ORF g.232218 m.232218 type:complete len:330 (-) comp18637_c0_seq1:43-1032(-)